MTHIKDLQDKLRIRKVRRSALH